MEDSRVQLRPLAVLATIAAGASVLLCVGSAMSNSPRLLGTGMLCLVAGALAFLAWALAATSELGRAVRELTAERPELSDGEFLVRFFPDGTADPETVSRVRRVIAARFKALGGGGFWPDDRLVEDLHLPELAPAELADLPAVLRRELGAGRGRWPDDGDGDAEAGWRSVMDVYQTALRSTGSGPYEEPPAAAGQ
jgi:hypothetical protein